MQGSPLPSGFAGYDWMDVGEPPVAVLATRTERSQRARRIGEAVMPVAVLAAAGASVLLVVPGARSWAIPDQVALFVLGGLPFAIGEFFFLRWFFGLLARATLLHARRVAILGDQLHVEPPSGNPYDYPLKRLAVADQPAADDWYAVTLMIGRFLPVLYTPKPVADRIRAAAAAPNATKSPGAN